MKKFFIFLTIVLCTLSSSVFAMTPTYANDAKFTRGVGNCCYYVDSSASGYTSAINDAAYNWENTGFGWNPIYMHAVASNYATHIDFYGATPSTDSYLTSGAQFDLTVTCHFDSSTVLHSESNITFIDVSSASQPNNIYAWKDPNPNVYNASEVTFSFGIVAALFNKSSTTSLRSFPVYKAKPSIKSILSWLIK